MEVNNFKQCFVYAADLLIEQKGYLCELDGVAGDGDHGITMSKVAQALKLRLDEGDGLETLFSDLAWDIFGIGGGAAVSLWGSLFLGMAAGIQEGSDLADIETLQDMFTCALEELRTITAADIGDKTMMDAFIPAYKQIMACEPEASIQDALEVASMAAKKGAQDTKKFKAKYGRAKNLGDISIGSQDPGATSMSLFLEGLYKGSLL